jgi:hypothetical protein
MPKPPCPLTHLVALSHASKLCTALGARLPSASWSFTLSASLDDQIISKTVGFQTVSRQGGVSFIVRKGSLPPKTEMALCHVSGAYPPTKDEPCRQWRMDGVAMQNFDMAFLQTAPKASLAQIIATAEFAKTPNDGDDAWHGGENGWGLLPPSARPSFVELVAKHKLRLDNSEVGAEELEDAVGVYTFVPERVELAESNEIWDRTEWWWNEETGGYNEPLTLMPY